MAEGEIGFLELGYDKGATWTPKGGDEYAVALSTSEAEDGGDLQDTTSGATGGDQRLIAATRRKRATVTFFFDVSAAPAAIGMAFGARGTIKLDTGQEWFVRVAKVLHRTAVAGAVTVTCEVMSDKETPPPPPPPPPPGGNGSMFQPGP